MTDLTRTKKEVESTIRSLNKNSSINDIKESLLEILSLIETEIESNDYDKRAFELLSERVSNIENCLDRNSKKLNIDDLRL